MKKKRVRAKNRKNEKRIVPAKGVEGKGMHELVEVDYSP